MRQKVQYSVEWFMSLPLDRQERVVRRLFEHAIDSEWISVWSPENQIELAEEEGCSIEKFQAPYFNTCGEPIDFDNG
jgi:hypothetical protein